jgi:signal transduction histidine kinase
VEKGHTQARAAPNAKPRTAPESVSPESGKPTVLVVDDDATNRALVEEALGDEGYRVVSATSGKEALELFESQRPDCVLLDVRMPDMDGFAVCERMRKLPLGEDVRILFLTAMRDLDSFEHALAAGGDDFLTKPVRPAELAVRVQTAVELRRLGAELGKQYALLKRQRDDLMRLHLQKERLMAFVVHDLKNPVHAMDLAAQLLSGEEVLTPVAREWVSSIRSHARQLDRMIMNLLDLAKADEGRLSAKKVPIHLGSVVAAVAAELDSIARVRHTEVQVLSLVEQLFADEDLIHRMLANLLENAIRHSPPETTVTVEARDVEDAVEIRVADCGPGVPRELRTRIFDAFIQVETEDLSLTRGGRGLGLAFCKEAVLAHGGEIWVDDAESGSVFCVRLPHG